MTEEQKSLQPLVQEATVFMQGKSEQLILPGMKQRTKNSRQKNIPENFKLSVLWKEFKAFDDGKEQAIVFPIEHPAMTATAFLHYHGRTKKSLLKSESKLIVRKRQDGSWVAIIGTYIYDKNTEGQEEAVRNCLHNFSETNYNGYFITSRLNGELLLGRKFHKGKEHFAFKYKESDPHCKNEAHDQDEISENDIHVLLNFGTGTETFRLSRSIQDLEYETPTADLCSWCHKPGNECRCTVATTCKICKKQVVDGFCNCQVRPMCAKCNSAVIAGQCLCCTYCGGYPCHCAGTPGTDNNSGNQGGNQNGGGTNGGSSLGGGGQNTGGSSGSGGGGSSNTGGHVKTPGRITSAASSAVAAMKQAYPKGEACCNFGVQYAFKQIYGSSNLPPGMTGRANEMCKAFANNPKYWAQISLSEAQQYANKGYFVVVGYQAPTGSGHVAVVVPGTATSSSKYKMKVPTIMDTGANRRDEKVPLSKGFGVDKKDKIKIYYYK